MCVIQYEVFSDFFVMGQDMVVDEVVVNVCLDIDFVQFVVKCKVGCDYIGGGFVSDYYFQKMYYMGG